MRDRSKVLPKWMLQNRLDRLEAQKEELLAYVAKVEDKLVEFCESSFLDELVDVAEARPGWLHHDAVPCLQTDKGGE